MRRKYKIKKKYSISIVVIMLAVVATILAMNIGYSMWGSKLNIYGKVNLNLKSYDLEVEVPSNGKGRYTEIVEFSTDSLEFVSDEYSENSLITTIKKNEDVSNSLYDDIHINFSIKNVSKDGKIYTNGKLEQMEVSNHDNALEYYEAKLSQETIAYGQSANFDFSASVNISNLTRDVYYKYSISYDVDGITRYFYYTIKVLANN